MALVSCNAGYMIVYEVRTYYMINTHTQATLKKEVVETTMH